MPTMRPSLTRSQTNCMLCTFPSGTVAGSAYCALMASHSIGSGVRRMGPVPSMELPASRNACR